VVRNLDDALLNNHRFDVPLISAQWFRFFAFLNSTPRQQRRSPTTVQIVGGVNRIHLAAVSLPAAVTGTHTPHTNDQTLHLMHFNRIYLTFSLVLTALSSLLLALSLIARFSRTFCSYDSNPTRVCLWLDVPLQAERAHDRVPDGADHKSGEHRGGYSILEEVGGADEPLSELVLLSDPTTSQRQPTSSTLQLAAAVRRKKPSMGMAGPRIPKSHSRSHIGETRDGETHPRRADQRSGHDQ
jgi:hypothetical protein